MLQTGCEGGVRGWRDQEASYLRPDLSRGGHFADQLVRRLLLLAVAVRRLLPAFARLQQHRKQQALRTGVLLHHSLLA